MFTISLVYGLFVDIVDAVDAIHMNERLNIFSPCFKHSRRTGNARGTKKIDWLGSFDEKKYKLQEMNTEEIKDSAETIRPQSMEIEKETIPSNEDGGTKTEIVPPAESVVVENIPTSSYLSLTQVWLDNTANA